LEIPSSPPPTGRRSSVSASGGWGISREQKEGDKREEVVP
jgi:hypothetical protein